MRIGFPHLALAYQTHECVQMKRENTQKSERCLLKTWVQWEADRQEMEKMLRTKIVGRSFWPSISGCSL